MGQDAHSKKAGLNTLCLENEKAAQGRMYRFTGVLLQEGFVREE